jgi:hypothetical protein
MALTVLRLPRSFAGDKAAPLEDFFNSMAHALARGDPAKKEAIQHFCDRVQANLCARAVFDIGGLQRMSRNNMLSTIQMAGQGLQEWLVPRPHRSLAQPRRSTRPSCCLSRCPSEG